MIDLTLALHDPGVADRALHPLVGGAELHAPDDAVERGQRDRQRDRRFDQRGAAFTTPPHDAHPRLASACVPMYGRIGTAFHQPANALNSLW